MSLRASGARPEIDDRQCRPKPRADRPGQSVRARRHRRSGSRMAARKRWLASPAGVEPAYLPWKGSVL